MGGSFFRQANERGGRTLTISMIAAAVVMLAGLIGTLALSGRGDEQYTSATKGNLTRLALIYAGLAIVLAAGIGVYLAL
ncbi:hypothetical protein GTCCBUS3UF5_19600 [Geobacillus thermoleovorans CCB_US3_UF5]|uniref:Uncharacterized protein n=1 Tax=Geobacillus thermoleovorans CCB_US3_UF5 TaxID=1111068 RepID=A0ABN3ZU52_GEOTH|nr:hypothetical protein GTCCBUS3UF5_19600 [Geobacillus thermoleovorans CCB_US3_UF5]OQP12640.1 hypothetical protein B1692_10800 [Geobacillus thermoleovorans]GAJ58937.1 hypothetical protein B23_2158 [Geobacillus thermoleovorans B23]